MSDSQEEEDHVDENDDERSEPDLEDNGTLEERRGRKEGGKMNKNKFV